jgi:hypothetical protein
MRGPHCLAPFPPLPPVEQRVAWAPSTLAACGEVGGARKSGVIGEKI